MAHRRAQGRRSLGGLGWRLLGELARVRQFATVPEYRDRLRQPDRRVPKPNQPTTNTVLHSHQVLKRPVLDGTGRRAGGAQLIQKYLELSIEDVLEALEAAAAHHSASLDTPREDADGQAGTLADAFGQEDERFEVVEASVSIAAAVRQLSPLERRVLAVRFVEDQTQTQIGELIGVSQMQVSQMQVSRILRRAVGRLEDLTQLRNEALNTP